MVQIEKLLLILKVGTMLIIINSYMTELEYFN